MRKKLTILTFFIALCTLGFGQGMHWTQIHQSDNSMSLAAVVKIGGELQASADIELAAFKDDECRGTIKLTHVQVPNNIDGYFAYLSIDGAEGDSFTFKLYDHAASKEYSLSNTVLEFDPNNSYSPFNPFVVTFIDGFEAMVGDNYYATLADAFKAVQDGETITLLQDVELSAAVSFNKDITFTIDGDGKMIKPAVGSTESNSAFNLGQGNDATVATRNYTIKNIVFDGWTTDHVVRLQGVNATVEGCTFQNCNQADGLGLLTLTFCEANVTACEFNDNTCVKAIDINSWGDDSQKNATIEECVFDNNTCNTTAVVVRSDGNKLVVKDSQFLNNNVSANGNAATLYAGWGDEDEITGCYFANNTVTTTKADTKRFASAIFCDGCTVTGNAFENNIAVRNGETIATTVAVGAYYGAANVSENYWGKENPVAGTDYTVEYTDNNVAYDSYYKSYSSDNGLTGKTELNHVAKTGKYYYATLADALKALKEGETLTLLDNVTISEKWDCRSNGAKITVPVTIDGNNHTLKLTGAVDDKNWNTVFRFEADATVKNLTIDVTEATGVQRCITTKSSIVAEGCTFKGADTRYGIIVGEGAGANNIGNVTANISKCSFENLQAGVSDNANGQDAKSFAITECEFNNADAVISAAENVTFNNNVMTNNSYVDIRSYANIGQLRVTALENTLDTNADQPNQIIAKLENITAQDDFATPVAEVNGKYYVTLQKAIDKTTAENNTVKVLQNVTLTESVTVAEGQTVVLDLNDKTITGTPVEAKAYAVITNKGNLTVKNGSIICNHTLAGSTAYAVNTIVNSGTFTLESGIIENTSTASNQIGYAIDNNSTSYNSVIVIKGGEVKVSGSNYYDGIRQFCNNMTAENSVTIEGGKVSSLWMQNPSDGSAERNTKDVKGSFAITGGELGALYLEPSTNFAGSISGGHVVNVSRFETAEGRDVENFISGGTFGMDVTEFCKFGFRCEANADGTYGVVESDNLTIATLAELVAFRDEVNAGNSFEGKTVELGADIDMTGINWTPIGSATADHGFMGNFDGKTYSIKNLTIENITPDIDGYVYAGLFGVTEGTDKDNQNVIKNLTIENVTINTTGHIVAAAIAYPYYTIVENVTVKGDITIQGGDYTSGVLAYTRRCVDASNLTVAGNEGSAITGRNTVGGVISDIQMNGGLTANYSNFNAEGIIVTGEKSVGGISGIIAAQTLNACSVKNVTLSCNDSRVGTVAGSLGGASTISNAVVENVTGATDIIGAGFDSGKPVQAKIGDKYYTTLQDALNAAVAGTTVEMINDIDLNGVTWTPVGTEEKPFVANFNGNGHTIKNFNIVETEPKEGKAYIGLIGYAKNTTIKDVVFENVNLNIACLDIDHSQGHIGAVAGSLEGTSTIENVTVKGDVKVEATFDANGASRVAVVAGGNISGNVTMKNVHVIANEGSYLKANNNVGALAGQFQDKDTFENCSSNINVTGKKFFAGGIIGLASGDSQFTNCHTTGDVTITAGREGRANDHYRVGGIAGGWADGKTKVCTLTNCTYKGTVSGTNADGSVADPLDYDGYVGRGYTLTNCAGSKVVIDGVEYVQAYNDKYGIYNLGISTPEALAKFAAEVNAGNSYSGVTVYLTADIDLAEIATRSESNWTPIGTKANPFKGTFDGQDHTVSNLKIDDAELSYAGLFGYAQSPAEIKNVKVYNVDINAYSNVGAIAGCVYTGNVENCHVSGTINLVSQYAYAGGITGYGYNNIRNCSVIAEETGIVKVVEKTGAGGIIGWHTEGNLGIYNCTVKNLDITAWANIGGITGFVHYENTIDGCVVDNVNLYKTRENGQASIGLAAGGWSNKADNADYIINITNNKFDNMSINGQAITSLNQLYGSNYSYYDVEIKLNDEGNTYGNIETNFEIVASNESDFEKSVAYVKDGETIKVGADFELTKTINVPAGKTIVLDLNGKTITGTDNNTTGNFYLIDNRGELTVTGEGTITLTAINERQWSSSSVVIANNPGGKLTINGGTIEHLGGTSMAYAIDNLTNGKATYAETTINGGTIKSTYRAVRQFLNGEEAQNILTVNGGTIEGTNKSIWMQDPSVKANTGTLTVGADATLNGDVYLTVTAGSTEWPVEVSVAAAALQGESTVLTNDNVPAGYELELVNGIYGIRSVEAKIGEVTYATLAAAVNAANEGDTITLVTNVTFTEATRTHNTGDYYDGLYYIGDKSFTIDLGSYTIGHDGSVNDYLLNFKNDGAKENVINLTNGTIDAGTAAYCALATSSSNSNKITINTENINFINNNSNGSTIKVRGGVELNVNAGTVITGKDSYLGIECSASTVNIYDGAEIYMKGTSSYNGCLVGVGGNGNVNVYGGKGTGVSGGFIAMTSGGIINVEGGEWIANTDGTYANDNKSVLIAQSSGGAKSIVNVTAGTFRGGYNCYGDAAGDAQINISGGNFNADPTSYLVSSNYKVVAEEDGTFTVEIGGFEKFYNAAGEETTSDDVAYSLMFTITDYDNTEVSVKIGSKKPAQNSNINLVTPTTVQFEDVAFNVTSVADSGFNGTRFKTITISEGVRTLGTKALANMYDLTAVVFPSTLEVVGDNCFHGYGDSHKIKSITSYAVEAPAASGHWQTVPFQQCIADVAVLIVPNASSYTEYKEAAGWSRFANIIGVGSTKEIAGKDDKYTMIATITSIEPNECSIQIGNTKPASGSNAELVLPGVVDFYPSVDGFDFTLTSIPDNAFSSCLYFVGNLEIPATVKTIGASAFNTSHFVANETVRGTLTLNEGLVSIGSQAFKKDSFKGDLSIPSTVETIAANAFQYATFDGTLTINGNIDCANAFGGSGFTKLVLAEGVEEIKDSNAFSGMTDLKEVVLPSTLQTVGMAAFKDDAAIEVIHTHATEVPAINSIPGNVNYKYAFSETVKENAILYVHTLNYDDVLAYQNAENEWSEFANIRMYAAARIGEGETATYYNTIAEAVKAANAGETIVLVRDGVEESVTINKSVTLDGADLTFAGEILVGTKGINVTIKNVNFDSDDAKQYAVKVSTQMNNLVVEDCTAKDYSYGFLYVNKSTVKTTVTNVDIENCNYGVHVVSCNNTVLENVNFSETVTNAVMVQNQGARKVTFRNCENLATNPITVWEKGTSTITFAFEGAENICANDLALNGYGKVVLASEDAVLTAKEGYDVTTTVELSIVKYVDGAYRVFPAVAKIGDVPYASIQEAIDAAQDGETVVLLQDVEYTWNDVIYNLNNYAVLLNVSGKDITLDMNGKVINVDHQSTTDRIYAVVSIEDGAGLTVTGEGTIDVNVDDNTPKVAYMFWKRGTRGHLTIENGTFHMDNSEDSMVYTNGSEIVTVNGGTFTLEAVGTRVNGFPCIFSATGQNTVNILVNGGTFNADVNHQYYAFEVNVPETKALRYDGDEAGTWTVVDAQAYVVEQSSGYNREVGYATLEEALAVAMDKDYTDVVLVADIETENSYSIASGETVVLDLNGKVVSMEDSSATTAAMIKNNGTLTIKDSGVDGKLSFKTTMPSTDNAYASNTISNYGTITIESGIIENNSLGGACYALDNYAGSTATIEGGKLVAEKTTLRIFNWTNGDAAKATLNIEGGEILSKDGYGVNFNLGNTPHVELNISGGIITTNDTDYNLAVYVVNKGSAENMTINVTGGTFDGYFALNGVTSTTMAEGAVSISGGTFEGVICYDTPAYGFISGGTFLTDVTAYCAPGFVCEQNENGTYSVVEQTIFTQTTQLEQGWNWFSYYVNTDLTALETALGENGVQITSKTDGFVAYNSQYGWSGLLSSITESQMYMINVGASHDLELSGELVGPTSITIHKGWNWIGFPMSEAVSVTDALAGFEAKPGDQIKSKDNGFASYNSQYGWGGTLSTLNPGEGYMYQSYNSETTELFYSAGTRGELKSNVTTDGNHWIPNAGQYANNMTMTAMVEVEGGDYEVAAFVNGEVRGSARPIYIEALDAHILFLTIHGEDVEEMTFRYYDTATGEEFDLNDRMNYSNDAIVGTVAEPYIFSRGTTGIGEASLSEVNIYPNPTTTGKEINLQATCDKVEVFNALGVKVAEYHNVDSLDAFETAGIYVIRLTNDGDVKHCRLVVK